MNFDTLENMNPEDLWNEIESGKFNLVRDDELNRIFTILCKKYEKLGDIQKSRRMLREVRIHSMFYNTDKGRFMQISEPWEGFMEGDMAYYINRARTTKNNVFKARYCDILFEIWEIRNDKLIASGINAYLDNAKFFSENQNSKKIAVSLIRALYLSKAIDNKSLLIKSINISFELIKNMEIGINTGNLVNSIKNIDLKSFETNEFDNYLEKIRKIIKEKENPILTNQLNDLLE